MSFTEGATVRFSADFTVAGTLTDPTTVSLKIKEPNTATVTYTYAAAEITKDSTGKYHKDVVLDTAGRVIYQWVGTGSAAVLVEEEVDIDASKL